MTKRMTRISVLRQVHLCNRISIVKRVLGRRRMEVAGCLRRRRTQAAGWQCWMLSLRNYHPNNTGRILL
jgi:hypothetical protein